MECSIHMYVYIICSKILYLENYYYQIQRNFILTCIYVFREIVYKPIYYILSIVLQNIVQTLSKSLNVGYEEFLALLVIFLV